jgi:DNA topoisomerase-1
MWIMVGAGKSQWTVFRHNGPFFPPLYEPHKLYVLYKNNKIILPPEAEEYATMYAKYLGTEYVQKPKFNKNFFNDFKKVLPTNMKDSTLEDFDFSKIKEYIDKVSEDKKNMSKEEKERSKKKK